MTNLDKLWPNMDYSSKAELGAAVCGPLPCGKCPFAGECLSDVYGSPADSVKVKLAEWAMREVTNA